MEYFVYGQWPSGVSIVPELLFVFIVFLYVCLQAGFQDLCASLLGDTALRIHTSLFHFMFFLLISCLFEKL